MVIWHARLIGRPTLVILGAAREAALVSWGAEGVSVARRSLPRGWDPCFSSVRRRASYAIWRVAVAARTARVALCVAMDAGVPACAALATRAGRRCDASAACAWLSDPMATANMARTNTSFLCIDSVPRSSYRWCPRWGSDLRNIPGVWGHPGPGRPPPGRIALISARAVRRSVPGFARHAAHPGVVAIIAVHGVHRRAGPSGRGHVRHVRPRRVADSVMTPGPGSSTSCPSPPPCRCGW